MFPRHVLEHMVLHPPSRLGTATPVINHLAHKHKNVTLMFMDIIGEASGTGGFNRKYGGWAGGGLDRQRGIMIMNTSHRRGGIEVALHADLYTYRSIR